MKFPEICRNTSAEHLAVGSVTRQMVRFVTTEPKTTHQQRLKSQGSGLKAGGLGFKPGCGAGVRNPQAPCLLRYRDTQCTPPPPSSPSSGIVLVKPCGFGHQAYLHSWLDLRYIRPVAFTQTQERLERGMLLAPELLPHRSFGLFSGSTKTSARTHLRVSSTSADGEGISGPCLENT